MVDCKIIISNNGGQSKAVTDLLSHSGMFLEGSFNPHHADEHLMRIIIKEKYIHLLYMDSDNMYNLARSILRITDKREYRIQLIHAEDLISCPKILEFVEEDEENYL